MTITVKNQRFVAPAQWDAQILRNHPAYNWLCQFFPLAQLTDFPSPAELTCWARSLVPDSQLTFVDHAEFAQDARYYEVIIAQTYQIPTRPANWHDFFGALVWLMFPLAKTALNLRHLAEINQHGSKLRSPLRHQLTLFDECGLLLLHTRQRQQLPQLLRQHLWTEGFFVQRFAWQAGVWPVIFGHANYEMLTRPFIGLTAKLWPLLVPEEFADWSLHQQVHFVDTALSKQIAVFSLTEFRETMSPLPLLGIPDWSATEQTHAFYQDQSYFRPKRVKPQP